jgi:4-hydroxy-2-oxoheptanedioate aldolase
MKSNLAKRKLREGKPTFGAWLSLDNLHTARLMARSGFDWLTLDLEHSAIDWSTAAMVFGAVADGGGVPLVRVPEGNHFLIKRALDAGAWGIVVPMVDTVEQARLAIAAAKYPPIGNRSIGPGMHSLNFGAAPSEYYDRANDEILVVLQTESPQGVENAEAIYSLPGCDAVMVGPADLRFQMCSVNGMPTNDELEAMIQRVIDIGRRLKVPTGIFAMDLETAQRRAQQGMQFISVCSEARMLAMKANEIAQALGLQPDASAMPAY